MADDCTGIPGRMSSKDPRQYGGGVTAWLSEPSEENAAQLDALIPSLDMLSRSPVPPAAPACLATRGGSGKLVTLPH